MAYQEEYRIGAAKCVLLVIALFMISTGLLGQEQELGLVVRSGQLDLASGSYSFELVNTYPKPVVGWTMAIGHKHSSGGSIHQVYQPDSCSLDTRPLPPGGVLR
jgi:hypothetical protein